MPCPSTTDQWITTLIQIGVPSLLTLVSLILTFCLGKAAHQKERVIATLGIDAERKKITSERQASLVKDIASAVSIVEAALGSYSGVFRRMSAGEGRMTDAMTKERNDAFLDLSSAVDKCTGARTASYLLGNSSISATFDLYMQDLFGFQRLANPTSSADVFQLSTAHDAIVARSNRLAGLLSGVFLENAPVQK